MKRGIVFLLVLCINIIPLFSQRIDNVWPLGYACCQGAFGTINLNFTATSVSINPIQRNINLCVTNGSIADSSNSLLFVSNGSFIFNSANDTMQNGSGLSPSYYTSLYTDDGLTMPQANLVIPSITNPNQYILIHNTMDDYFNSGASLFLYYSIIDMNQNGGLGAVISKNNVLHNDSMVPGRITACKHANGRDWWIIVNRLYSSEIIEFLYTPSGFLGPWYKSLFTWRNIQIGQCSFNPQGNKFAYYNAPHGLDIADFDRCTGDLSNIIHIDTPDGQNIGGGVAFSSSGRYLYVSNITNMYQYDTWAPNVDSSVVNLGPYDGFVDTINGLGTYFYGMQLAPNNKIYMATPNTVRYLHVVNSPDSVGLAADFCQHCLMLPVRNAFTIPNHPNYYLGAESGSICDTLMTDISYPETAYSISVFPNPVNSRLFFLSNDSATIEEITLKDIFGRLILTAKNTSEIDVSSVNSGLYIVTATIKNKKITTKITIQH